MKKLFPNQLFPKLCASALFTTILCLNPAQAEIEIEFKHVDESGIEHQNHTCSVKGDTIDFAEMQNLLHDLRTGATRVLEIDIDTFDATPLIMGLFGTNVHTLVIDSIAFTMDCTTLAHPANPLNMADFPLQKLNISLSDADKTIDMPGFAHGIMALNQCPTFIEFGLNNFGNEFFTPFVVGALQTLDHVTYLSLTENDLELDSLFTILNGQNHTYPRTYDFTHNDEGGLITTEDLENHPNFTQWLQTVAALAEGSEVLFGDMDHPATFVASHGATQFNGVYYPLGTPE